MNSIDTFLESYGAYAVEFFSFLGSSTHRLFIPFILTTLAVAYVIYMRKKSEGSFIEFLFPKSVWSNPAAWLDVRYFFFHGLIGHFFLFGVATSAYVIGILIGTGFAGYAGLENISPYGPVITYLLAGIALLIVTLINDFMAFYIHYIQHKIPLLWQFHKVHHSGEVMHPLSNYREHPIDNLAYKFIISLVTGITWGLILLALGFTPTSLNILGLSIFALSFNLAAYHLRHSHIWLKWPGIWSKVFASPAHHHVHHSRHPDHLDKNFAFIFPIWDVLFGCYHMPEDNKDVEFGIVEDSSELNSCVNFYVIPFRDAYRLLTKPKEETVAAAELEA